MILLTDVARTVRKNVRRMVQDTFVEHHTSQNLLLNYWQRYGSVHLHTCRRIADADLNARGTFLGELRSFLMEQRAAYMMTCAGLAGSMSDADRNQVAAATINLILETIWSFI